jgi:EAL domain-containing protein (putative c-di-GMP-specific phosphodiesterase class I)
VRQDRNRYPFFTTELEEAFNVQLKVERELKASIEHEEFFLVYIPTYEIGPNILIGAEALLRSTNPNLLACGSDIFMPVAESTGLIKTIDLWIIEQALMALNHWISDYVFDGMLSVNISAVELYKEHFIHALTD